MLRNILETVLEAGVRSIRGVEILFVVWFSYEGTGVSLLRARYQYRVFSLHLSLLLNEDMIDILSSPNRL